MMAIRIGCLLVWVLGSSAACTDYPDAVEPHGDPYAYLKPEGSFVPSSSEPGGTSWHKDVRPLVERYCVRCHTSGGIAPMALDSYAATAQYRDAMVTYVVNGTMPPWPFDPECHDLATVRVPSAAEKQVFLDWREDGFDGGAVSDYVPPSESPAFDPAGEVEVALARAAQVPASDGPRCYLLSQQVTVDNNGDPRGWWVTDLRITPEHSDMVEQATLYQIAAGEAAGVPSADDGYACPDGAGTESEEALLAWVPGQGPLSFDQETALLVPAGSRFVMRVRYRVSHLAGDTPADGTTATLWRYSGRRAPSAAQIRMYPVRATSETPVETFLPHSQRIIGMVPEMGPGGESLVLEYMTGPVGTCMARSERWDERFPETLLFAADRTTNALFGNRTRLSCTFEDDGGAVGQSCRATIIGTFPRFDSIQPLGQTCSGVNECMLACSSASSSCLYDCIAWEQPACGDCAREQVFHACAEAANPTQYENLARCEAEHCSGLAPFSQWLPCMVASCRSELDIMQATLLAELPKGTCNREEEACVYVPVVSP